METPELEARLVRALRSTGPASSDFDLNPGAAPRTDRALRDAAVLIAVCRRPGGWAVLLTKRASGLKHHPGQIAFPGGKVDAGDDGPIGAALREAQEEVGLDPALVRVLGTLPTHETITGFQVTPVLAVVEAPFDPVVEAGEVEEAFFAPLGHVTDPARFQVQRRRWLGTSRAYFTVPWGPYYIWGATARMLRALAARIA